MYVNVEKSSRMFIKLILLKLKKNNCAFIIYQTIFKQKTFALLEELECTGVNRVVSQVIVQENVCICHFCKYQTN